MNPARSRHCDRPGQVDGLRPPTAPGEGSQELLPSVLQCSPSVRVVLTEQRGGKSRSVVTPRKADLMTPADRPGVAPDSGDCKAFRPSGLIADAVSAISGPDGAAAAQARQLQERLTKPSGSLGVLEDLSVRLAGLTGLCPPPVPEPAVIAIFAGDHGVHAQGVTPWPQEVTAQMVANFLANGAVVNALAAQTGADVRVVDVGVIARLPAAPGLIARNVRPGTADMTTGPAKIGRAHV